MHLGGFYYTNIAFCFCFYLLLIAKTASCFSSSIKERRKIFFFMCVIISVNNYIMFHEVSFFPILANKKYTFTAQGFHGNSDSTTRFPQLLAVWKPHDTVRNTTKPH